MKKLKQRGDRAPLPLAGSAAGDDERIWCNGYIMLLYILLVHFRSFERCDSFLKKNSRINTFKNISTYLTSLWNCSHANRFLFLENDFSTIGFGQMKPRSGCWFQVYKVSFVLLVSKGETDYPKSIRSRNRLP